MRFLFTYFLCLLFTGISAQDTIVDPVKDVEKKSVVFKKDENHSPKKAGMLSAIVPGFGQIYNRKFWKLPIVYGALGGVGYLAYFNTQQYNFWHNGLIISNAITNKQKTTDDLLQYAKSKNLSKFTSLSAEDLSTLNESEFQTNNDYYRRNRDLSFFFLGLLYMANILDATVDGHLYNFDVTNDLSLHIQPTYINSYYYNSPGLGLSLSAKF